jgi:MFS family permease
VTGDAPRRLGCDAARILAARGVRAFGDGYVALLMPIYLAELAFSSVAIGTVVASTLIGTALLTLWVGAVANAIRGDACSRRRRC